MIHGDIKPGNILLDQYCEPKIGDFGLSREGQRDKFAQLSVIYGTREYLPPEFLTRNLCSTLVDVFSFGVVLFEIATGLKALNEDLEPPLLYKYVTTKDVSNPEVLDKLMDKSTEKDDWCSNLCKELIEVARRCTNYSPECRPKMQTVLEALESFYSL